MVLEHDLLARTLAVFENRYIALPEAKELAHLLGSKEELVAHLFLKRDALSRHHEVAAELRRVSAESHAEAVSDRKYAGQLSWWNDGAEELRKSLAGLLAAERSQHEIARRVCEAFKGLAHHAHSEGIEVDLQWRVGPEKGPLSG